MTSSLTSETAMATARTAGLDLTPETALRIVTAIAPAIDTFAPLVGTLPLDLEPATFQRIQAQGEEQ
ncbi:MAG: hypothetical protein AB1698_19585 [Pseudomonadota bacterium]